MYVCVCACVPIIKCLIVLPQSWDIVLLVPEYWLESNRLNLIQEHKTNQTKALGNIFLQPEQLSELFGFGEKKSVSIRK